MRGRSRACGAGGFGKLARSTKLLYADSVTSGVFPPRALQVASFQIQFWSTKDDA